MDECLPSQTAEISYACVFLHLVMAMSRLLTDEGRSFVQLLLQDYRLVSSSQSGLTNLLTYRLCVCMLLYHSRIVTLSLRSRLILYY